MSDIIFCIDSDIDARESALLANFIARQYILLKNKCFFSIIKNYEKED